jgi:hypothetical protein
MVIFANFMASGSGSVVPIRIRSGKAKALRTCACATPCCGSGMFIPDPNYSIPDPGSEFFPSRIPDPHQIIKVF